MSESLTLGDLLTRTGGSVKTGPFGTVLKAREYTVTGVPLVSVGEIGDGIVQLHRRTPRISPEVVARLPEYVLRTGDVVFARKGAVDRSAQINAHEDGYFLGSDGIRVRFGDGVSSRFLAFQFRSEATREWLNQHAAGTTMASMNQTILERLPVTLPPLRTQDAIAETLGAIDDKIAANQVLVDTAVALVDAEYQRLSQVSSLSDSSFADLAVIGGGGTPRTSVSSFWDGEILWATPTDITALRGPYLTTTSRTISEAGLAACSSPLYPAGSILMTSRATIGAFAIAQRHMAVNQGFIVVNAHEASSQWWLFHEMRSRVDEFVSHANGATFLELSRGKFRQFRVRLADATTMTGFSRLAEAVHARSSAALTENVRLSVTRDALLPHLMSGRLRIKDAERVVGEVF